MSIVNLQDIIDEMVAQTEEFQKYLNTETGEIVGVSLESMEIAEEADDSSGDDDFSDYTEWQKDEIQLAIDILTSWDSEKYIKLPDVEDIHESGMMEEFCDTQDSGRVGDALYSALRGKDAVEKFKTILNRYDIEDSWYSFRDEAYKMVAIEWCEENDVQYE